MYNCNFEVKYHLIEDELILKLKNKPIENENTEYEYSNDDVFAICDKLYRDELMSVFYADCLTDDKIDIGMKYILEKMLENNNFKTMTDEIKELLKNTMTKEEEVYLETVIILTLFGKETFWLFHKCVCQQLNLGLIEPNLLDQLKQYFTHIQF